MPGTNPTRDADEEPECASREGDLVLLADGELGEHERGELEAHLAVCGGCRRTLGREQALRSMLRARGSGMRAPRMLRARVLEALELEPPPASRQVESRWQWPAWLATLWRPVPVAAAAGATALGLTAWMWAGSPRDDVVRQLVSRHAHQLPLDVQSNDPRALEAWLADKVEFRVRVPRVPEGMLSLRGARVSSVGDRNAVYFLYGHPRVPERRVSFVVFDDPADRPPIDGRARHLRDPDVWLANSRGYNVAAFKDKEIVYSIVSDAEDDVLEVVRALDAR